MSQNSKIPFGTDGLTQIKESLENHWKSIERPSILEAGCGSGNNGLQMEFAKLRQSGMQQKLSMKESDCICLFRKPNQEGGS